MIYIFRRAPDGAVNLYKYPDGTWNRERLPTVPLIDASFTSAAAMQTLALSILLDWFADEDETERKAVAFSAAFGVKLTKLAARRQVMYTSGRRGWDIGSDEIEKMVAEIIVTAAEMAAAYQPTEKQVKVIEYIMGQRRDTVRQAALQETTSRRLMN